MAALHRSEAETQAIMDSWRLEGSVLVWKRNAGRVKKVGDPVGFSTRKAGHRNVYLTINGKLFCFVYARVVWLLHYGEWPTQEIDHIDCNPQNDAIENLRQASRSENNRNTRGRMNKVCKGTFKDKRTGKWHCQVQLLGKVYGRYGFDTEQQAYEARMVLAKDLHGEFAR